MADLEAKRYHSDMNLPKLLQHLSALSDKSISLCDLRAMLLMEQTPIHKAQTLTAQYGWSGTKASQILRRLREAGCVKSGDEQMSAGRTYSLTDDGARILQVLRMAGGKS